MSQNDSYRGDETWVIRVRHIAGGFCGCGSILFLDLSCADMGVRCIIIFYTVPVRF